MSLRRVGLVLVVACGTPTSVKPAPPVAAARPALPHYEPPAISSPPPFHVECHAFTGPPAATGRKKVYDFMAIEILPIRRGPKAADRPHFGTGRSTRDLR